MRPAVCLLKRTGPDRTQVKNNPLVIHTAEPHRAEPAVTQGSGFREVYGRGIKPNRCFREKFFSEGDKATGAAAKMRTDVHNFMVYVQRLFKEAISCSQKRNGQLAEGDGQLSVHIGSQTKGIFFLL
jgi:hypothetical protein